MLPHRPLITTAPLFALLLATGAAAQQGDPDSAPTDADPTEFFVEKVENYEHLEPQTVAQQWPPQRIVDGDFALTLPAGWALLDEANRELIRAELVQSLEHDRVEEVLRSVMQTGHIALWMEESEFTLTVQLQAGLLRPRNDELPGVEQTLRAEIEQFGVQVLELQASVEPLGERRVLRIDSRTRAASADHAVEQQQWYLPSGSRHAVLTFTAPAGRLLARAAEVRQVLAGAELAPAPPRFSLQRAVRQGAVYMAVGGGIALIVLLFQLLRRRRKPTPDAS